MTMVDDWRDDPGLQVWHEYKRKFALVPVTCEDGMKVYFKHYYKKYSIYSDRIEYPTMNYDSHREFVENISEEEYISRKIADTL